MQKTIIITSVGSLVGQNILDALEHRREHLHIIGTNSIVEAANNYRCDKTYMVPLAVEKDSYIEALISIIETEKPDVIIPGRDDDIVILAQMKAMMPKYQGCFLVGSEAFAHVMDDKVKSYHFAQKYDLPFAQSIECGTDTAKEAVQLMVRTYGFPLIAKPSKGNGSYGIWAVMNNVQLDKVIEEKNYAIQPLFGQSDDIEMDTSFGLPFFWEIPENNLYAAQVLIDKDGNIVESIGFISKMVAGKCELLKRCTDPELLAIVHQFAECAVKEGWRGPFNIQLKKDSHHGFQTIEMNGRFSGGTSARFYLGFDEVGHLINMWTGSDIVPDTSEKEGIDMITKILSDFPIRRIDMEQLQAEKVWKADK